MIEVLLTSSVLILALALLRRGLRGRIDPRLQYALWLLVVLRLLIPGSLFPAPLTVSGALSDWEASLAADDTVPASAADAPAQSPAAGTPSQPTGADVTALPVLGPLYDVYTEEKDFPLGTSPDQWLQEAPGEDYTVNGVEVDLEQGKQTVTYSQYDSVWSMPFWRWPLYAGTALVGTVLLLSNLKFYLSLRKRRRRIPPSELPTACGARVYLAEGLASPCLVGLLRPAIYLNEAALDPGRLEHILVHEETHRRHGDQLWGLVRGVCLALYWYDPLVWWAAVLSRRDCELACDHSAIRRLGEDRRLDYGQTLVSMIVPGRPLTGLLRTATTMSEGKRTMKERIALIVHRPRMLKVTLAAVAVIVAAVVVLTFGGSWEDAPQAGEEAPTSSDIVPPEDTGALNRREGVYTFLVAGLDTVSGNTDALILVTFDTTSGQISCLSIPRDTAVDVPWDLKRICSVYSTSASTGGGIEGLKTKVSQLTGVYPDYYLVADLEAVAQLVDALGGVEFDVPQDMDYDDEWQDLHIHLAEGRQVLDGEAAVGLVSYRRYAEGDIQRIQVQQDFLEALARKCLDLESWSQVLDLAGIFTEYVETDLPTGSLLWFAQQAMGLNENDLQFFTIPGNLFGSAWSGVYGDQSYVFADPEATAGLVNQYFNPYTQPISSSDLHIMGVDEDGRLTVIGGTADSGVPTLRSTTYDHPSGMFSLSLPEEWVGNVLCLDTEDGVTFMETNIYEPAGHYRTLARVVPEPTSWVENNLSENMISLGSFDTNGVPHQYVLRHLSSDPSAENALASSDPIVTLLSQRDQIGFRSSVTPELIDQLVHDSYESDMAAAIAYLPYLSWSSYRDTYGKSDMFSLLSALREYAGSGQAEWRQYHNILSVPVDSAIDGAYATAYQDVLWALYDSNPEYFAGVLGSDYITDAERDNAVYWLRAPLAWADGREEPLSDNAVRQRLGLPTDAETSETGLTDGEVINGYGRALGPAVAAVPAHPGGEVIWNTPIVSTPEEAILLTLEEHGRSYLGDNFSQILLEDITYSLPEEDAHDEATVSYRIQASTTFTLPSGSPYTLTMETGLLTTTFTLTSRYEILLDGMAAQERLVSCFEFTEIPVSVGTDADPRQLILDTINANMDAEGVTGYEISLELSSQPDLSSLSVGDRAEVSYDFSAEGEFSLDGTREIAFVITE